ncbi:MAG: XTP/dITP diphosphatase [Phycisphaerae bacterium]|nr:XTP/dITP diphosphatase [Phycisphaerae bacterium]
MESAPAIVIATSNAGKLREVRQALAEVPARLLDFTHFDAISEPEETGETFAENARLKAAYYACVTNQVCIADDSGLEVGALGGLPGVHSARFAGWPRNDAANNTELIRRLAGVPPERRTARFRCVLALARGTEVLQCVEGSVEGIIMDTPRGTSGFGYDPHFYIPSLGKTAAELDPVEKNRISHRGRALARLVPHLVELIQNQKLA